MAVPIALRWAARHGLIKVAVSRAARRGQPDALLMSEPEACLDPFPYYERVRARGEIYQGSITFVAPSHAAASAVLRSDTFRVGLNLDEVPRWLRGVLGSEGSRAVGPLDPPSLLALNDPDHSRLRRQVSKVFTARAVRTLELRVQEIADELLDELEARADDEIDLMRTYAGLLPVTVISEILGVPLAMREQFLRWGEAGSPALDVGLGFRQFRAVERSILELNAWLYGHIGRLRADPGDDLLSRLIAVDDDGVRMTDRELMATALFVLAAGFETTVNLLGHGVHLLLTHPDQLARLRADPSLWGNAVDEILRYESPIQHSARWASSETVICDEVVPRNAFVLMMIGSANRDPAVFDDPDVFDVGRANAHQHLAFSAGQHYCIGAALARAEGRIGLQTLFERYPDLALAGPPVRRSTRTLRGLESLPVRFRSLSDAAVGSS